MAIPTQDNQEGPEEEDSEEDLLSEEELNRLLDRDWEMITEATRMDNALTELLTTGTIPEERLAEILHLLAKSEDLGPLLGESN